MAPSISLYSLANGHDDDDEDSRLMDFLPSDPPMGLTRSTSVSSARSMSNKLDDMLAAPMYGGLGPSPIVRNRKALSSTTNSSSTTRNASFDNLRNTVHGTTSGSSLRRSSKSSSMNAANDLLRHSEHRSTKNREHHHQHHHKEQQLSSQKKKQQQMEDIDDRLYRRMTSKSKSSELSSSQHSNRGGGFRSSGSGSGNNLLVRSSSRNDLPPSGSRNNLLRATSSGSGSRLSDLDRSSSSSRNKLRSSGSGSRLSDMDRSRSRSRFRSSGSSEPRLSDLANEGLRPSGSRSRLSDIVARDEQQESGQSHRSSSSHSKHTTEEERPRSLSRKRSNSSRRRTGSDNDLKSLASSRRPRSSGDLRAEEANSYSSLEQHRGSSHNDLKSLASSRRTRSSGDLRAEEANSYPSLEKRRGGSHKDLKSLASSRRPRSSGDLRAEETKSYSSLEKRRSSRRSGPTNSSKSLSPGPSARQERSWHSQSLHHHRPSSSSSSHSKSPSFSITEVKKNPLAKYRNGVMALLEAEYKKQQQEKTKDVKCQMLRNQLEFVKAQWIKTRMDSDADIRALQQQFDVSKQKVREQVTKDFWRRQEEADKQQAKDLEAKREEQSDEIVELYKEKESLQADMDALQALISSAKQENEKIEKSNAEIEANFVGLTKWCIQKTAEQEKLQAARDQMEQIHRGLVGLMAEPNVKNVYRDFMYRVGRGVQTNDLYDHDLYLGIWDQIRSCESELGSDVLQEEGTKLFVKMQRRSSLDVSFMPRINIDTIEEEDDDESSFNENESEYGDWDVKKFTEEAEKENAAMSKLSGMVDDTQMSSLYQNKDMLITVFRFLDKDGGGTIDPEEFRMGMDLLNRRLPAGAQFDDPDKLFKALDVDGSGELDLEEFNEIFSQ